ncbi:MAG: SPOR domain-containing protein [Rhodoferax sp.]|uniref:SPOR domain-containing protein n=1 Tax=Rhodoferax sp. TaxID=50421 RepID=UPI0030180632
MRMKQQRGGTLLGFIIGLVVGLGVALAVAVYVTKVPIPFVNKGQSRTPDQDAAETKKNKDWDPNAPLYGKNPAKPAVPAVPATPEAVPATTPVATPATATVPTPVAKAASKPAVSADPLGDLAKARAATATVEPFAYFVQVGAFRTAEDAEAQRAKLSLGGVEAKVTEREQAGRVVFRVRVGPFDKKEDADKSKEKMDATGLDTALVRVQR